MQKRSNEVKIPSCFFILRTPCLSYGLNKNFGICIVVIICLLNMCAMNHCSKLHFAGPFILMGWDEVQF